MDPLSQNGLLSLAFRDGVARLTIHRPEKRNALNHAMWLDLVRLVGEAQSLPDARAIVLTGEGEHFSAGADISEFETLRGDAESARAYEASNSDAFAALRNSSLPVIAAIRGICFGGGFGMAAACDLRIAGSDAQFCIPAARLGLTYPHDAMGDIVNACGQQLARLMAFTGRRLSAGAALASGVVLEVTEPEELEERAMQLALEIAAAAPLSVRASKMSIRAVLSGREDEASTAFELGAATFESSDYAEGRSAFLERRAPRFAGK